MAKGKPKAENETSTVTVYEEAPLYTDVQNADERYSYFWAAEDNRHPQSVEAFKLKGWEPVPADAKEGSLYGSDSKGYKTVGELVLMRKPKELVEKDRERRNEFIRRRLSAQEEAFEQRIADTEGVEKEDFVSFGGGGKRSFYIANNPLAKNK